MARLDRLGRLFQKTARAKFETAVVKAVIATAELELEELELLLEYPMPEVEENGGEARD